MSDERDEPEYMRSPFQDHRDSQDHGDFSADLSNPYALSSQPDGDEQKPVDQDPVTPYANAPPPPATLSGVLINGFCFLLIISLVGMIFFVQGNGDEEAKDALSPHADLAELTFQSKVLLGVSVLANGNPALKDAQEEQQKVKYGTAGSVRKRQAGAVMAAELESTDDALVVLANLKKLARKLDYSFSETESKTTRLLEKLFQESPNALSPTDKAHLREELLWFGELALHPARKNGPIDIQRKKILAGAESTIMTVVGIILLGILALFVGFVGGIVMVSMYSGNRLNIRTSIYSSEPTIYLECFTVWLFAFFIFSMIVGLVAPETNPLTANAVVFLTSLATGLLWSVFRGKFGTTFRKDIGYFGNPLAEVPAAIWCYVCALPLVALGLITSSALLMNFAGSGPPDLSGSGPTHPILEWVMKGDPTTIFMVFFVACVCAPVVEETMFRGCFYRALKDNSFRLGHFASTLFAAVINGLLFAAIHPQGIFFIPALCSLGMGFSFAREWRGTIWTPMIMHALHNGILTATLVYIVTA